MFKLNIKVHDNGIIHRDIKPGNILLDKENNAKICIFEPKKYFKSYLNYTGDFGLAFIMSNEDVLKSSKGTYHFMAPEMFNEKKIELGISGKMADIWSLGVTLYCLTFLVLPFYGKNTITLIDAIKSKTLKFPPERKISPELKKLFTKILEKNPKKRITLEYFLLFISKFKHILERS